MVEERGQSVGVRRPIELPRELQGLAVGLRRLLAPIPQVEGHRQPMKTLDHLGSAGTRTPLVKVEGRAIALLGAVVLPGLDVEISQPFESFRHRRMVFAIELPPQTERAIEEGPGLVVERQVGVGATQGLEQVDNQDELAAIIDGVLEANPEELERYQGGEKRLLGFFMGQVMRASKGTANPQSVRELLSERLG